MPQPVDEALTFLLEHLPPQMHLVITTREDPQLPLARLRARGQLTELRAADLRFTPAEAAEFLNQVMGLNLSAEDIAALESRTEGWIAGLQLAALSMQGHQDVPGFIQAFAGDHRYIVDYLVEEVLQRQPEPVRSFLLQTAILDRLEWLAVRCRHRPDRKAARGWRRWSAATSLSFRWMTSATGIAITISLPTCSRRICWQSSPIRSPRCIGARATWYEQNGLPADAIRHALAAKDFERAADLIELAVPAMRRSQTGGHAAGLAQGAPRRAVPLQTRAQRSLCRGVTAEGRARGR